MSSAEERAREIENSIDPFETAVRHLHEAEEAARAGAQRERDEALAEAAKWRRIRKPTHGSCCTCQACGLDYDSCRCDLDEVADSLDEARKQRDEALRRVRAHEQGDALFCRGCWAPWDAEEIDDTHGACRTCGVITTPAKCLSWIKCAYLLKDALIRVTGDEFVTDGITDEGWVESLPEVAKQRDEALAALEGGAEPFCLACRTAHDSDRECERPRCAPSDFVDGTAYNAYLSSEEWADQQIAQLRRDLGATVLRNHELNRVAKRYRGALEAFPLRGSDEAWNDWRDRVSTWCAFDRRDALARAKGEKGTT